MVEMFSGSSDQSNDRETGQTTSATPIEPWRLALTMLGPAIFLAFSYYLELGLNKKLILAIVRSSIQLLFLGYVLLNYIFSLKSIPIIFLYLFCMVIIAALELTGRQVRTYKGHYWDALLGCLCGGGLVGVYANLVIFHPTPWYKPEVMIPTAGMIIGNSVSGPAQTVERLLSEVCEKQHEVESRLCFGASAYEAILPKMRIALQASLLPMLNQFAIMGIVSIPGMMTGQLLGGTKPLVAAEYQMATLYLILTTTVVTSILATLLAIRHALFDLQSHRVVAAERVFKRQGGKLEVDSAIYSTCLMVNNTVQSSFIWMKMQFVRLLPSRSAASNGSSAVYSPVSSIELFASSHGTRSMSNRQDVESTQSSSLMLTSDDAGQGRVTYTIETNRTSIQQGQNGCAIDGQLVLTNVNILSATCYLFQPDLPLNLSIRKGEVLTLEGASGIGKTRLLRAIAQLDVLPQGTMSISDLHVKNVPTWRKYVMYVPQALPPMSGSPKDFIQDCSKYASRKHDEGIKFIIKDIDGQLERIERSLCLRQDILSSPWSTLSGGERQRALIACAVILVTSTQHPTVLLLDEPTAACDPTTTLAVESVLLTCGASILMTTHDERQAKRIAHRRVLLSSVDAS